MSRLSLKPSEQGWMIVEGDRAVLMVLPTKAEAEAHMNHLERYLTDLVHRERAICVSQIRHRMDDALREIDVGDYPA